MSEESAKLFEKAKESDTTAEEALRRMRERNKRIDWDIERMLPELFEE